MSLIPKTNPSVSVAGPNTANQTVTLPFAFIKNADLIVQTIINTGTVTNLTSGSGYTVTGSTSEGITPPGAVVTIISAVPATSTIKVLTTYPCDQENDILARAANHGFPIDGPYSRDEINPTGNQFTSRRNASVKHPVSASNN